MLFTYEPQMHATDDGLDQLTSISLNAQEGLSTPYQFVILARTIIPTDPASLDPGTWLRKKLAIGVSRNADPIWFHGIVTAVEHLGGDDKQNQQYRIELAPAFALLRHTRRTRVFTDQKPLDVVKSILADGGVTVEMKATGAGGVMRHITQFEESDFAFVSRLLEQEGACYWFTHTKSAHTMVIGDAENHHPGSGNAIHATYDGSASMVAVASSEGMVTALSRRFEVVAKDAIVRDYSEGHPKQAAMAQKSVAADKTPGSGGKHHEADYHVTQTDADATAYATRLAESLTSRSCRVVGASSVVAFRAGARIAVHGKDDYDEHIVLSQVTHSLADGNYSNSFDGIPVGRLPWRPARTTPIPRIDGVIPAVVTAAAGAQGQGEDGSYKVKILSEEGGKDRIVRMAQPYGGSARGMHFPLPVDTEVVLTHEYGHPDRPIIAGAMYNAEDASQVVEENKSQCVVRSAANASLVFEDVVDSEWVKLTSKSGNQLSFEDASGSELVALNAVKDLKVTVAKAETRTVGTDKNEKIEGAVITSVGKDATTTVKGNTSVTVEGNHKGSVAGTANVTVTKETKLQVDAGLTATVAKDLTLTCEGQGIWSATKDMVLETSAALSITSTKKTTWEADGITVDSKGDIVIKAGQASITMKKSGEIIIKGSKVKVEGSGDVVIKGSKTAVN